MWGGLRSSTPPPPRLPQPHRAPSEGRAGAAAWPPRCRAAAELAPTAGCVCVCPCPTPVLCPRGWEWPICIAPPPTPSAAPPRALPSLCALPRGCGALHVRPALRFPPEVAVLAGLCIQEEPGVTPDPRAAYCGAARTPTPHSVLLCASLPVPALICTVCSNLKITHPPRSPLPGGVLGWSCNKTHLRLSRGVRLCRRAQQGCECGFLIKTASNYELSPRSARRGCRGCGRAAAAAITAVTCQVCDGRCPAAVGLGSTAGQGAAGRRGAILCWRGISGRALHTCCARLPRR